jgi:magnesium-protoporphyrin O-methyltransferase
MQCCQCQAIETEFSQTLAARELNRYRKKGSSKTTRLLIDAIKADGVDGLTLLDIGGGVGAIQHELLRAGAARATDVEASTAYIDAARAEAERQGHADRVTFQHGNFVDLAPDIPPADIVTLDRVICCYPDMPALVRLSAARTLQSYGLVYPRDTWWMKSGLALVNLMYWLRRNPFRVFVHPTAAVDAVVRDHGLERRFYRRTFIWQVVVYGR